MRKKTIEDYVEIIYVLGGNNGRVRTSQIANALSLSPASVTEVLQKLAEEEYIQYRPYNGAMLLEKGQRLAMETKKRHDTLKKVLMLLGVEESIAEEDACKIEHIVHPETMRRIRKFVEFASNRPEAPLFLENFEWFVQTGKRRVCPREKK